MTATKKKSGKNQTTNFGEKKVKLASPSEVKASSDKMKNQYAQALKNLKNR